MLFYIFCFLYIVAKVIFMLVYIQANKLLYPVPEHFYKNDP
jgi:hypothetical protein